MVTQEERSKFRILWHSVSPHIRSGYGNVTRQVLTRLKEYGYDVFVSAYYGIEPGGVLLINNIPCMPAKHGRFGEISCIHFYKTLKANLGVLHSDPWAFDWFSGKLPSTLCYGPLDHVQYPEEIQNIMRGYTYRVSPSYFQQKEWDSYNPPVHFDVIYHGCDTKIFFPMDKSEAKKMIGLSDDLFVFGGVFANSDKENRKGITQTARALEIFFDNNKDLKKKDFRYFIFSNPIDQRGLQLELFLKKHGLREISILQNPLLFETGIKEQELCTIYNSFDLQLYNSYREGFGIPILEGMSCGVPSMVTNFSSMPELVEGRGWIVEPMTREHPTPINALTAIPDPYKIAEALEDAYFDDKKRAKYSRESRKFALQNDWDDIVRDKWLPLLDSILEESKPKPVEDRKIA